jgi:gliding motility-associated-like protein
MKYYLPAALLMMLFSACNRNNDERLVCQLGDNPGYYYGYGSEVMLPNAFTPNGDGRNDMFRALGDFSSITYFNLQIVENGSNILYESNDINAIGWDGRTTSGTLMSPGRYVARLSYRYFNGETRTIQYCIALLSYGGNSCIPTSYDGSYIFEDMYNPSSRSFNYGTSESICY